MIFTNLYQNSVLLSYNIATHFCYATLDVFLFCKIMQTDPVDFHQVIPAQRPARKPDG